MTSTVHRVRRLSVSSTLEICVAVCPSFSPALKGTERLFSMLILKISFIDNLDFDESNEDPIQNEIKHKSE